MKVLLTLSARADALGRHEVLLSAQNRVNGRVVRMRAKSGVRVLPAFFSAERGVDLSHRRLIAPDVRDFHLAAARRLGDLLAAIAEAEAVAERADLTGDWLRRVVEGFWHPERGTTAGRSFYELAAEYVARSSFGVACGMHLWNVVRAVSRYERFVRATDAARRCFNFDPERVDNAVIEDFMDYLRVEYRLRDEHPQLFAELTATYPAAIPQVRERRFGRRGENSVRYMMRRLKALWHWMNETRRVRNNAFLGVRLPAERYGTPFYLTVAERDAVARAELPTAFLRTQRDVFVFQCLVGCRVSDLMRLTEANVQDGMLTYTPHKTRNEGASPMVVHVPLLPRAQALIAAYRGQDDAGRLFPFVAVERYNGAIREVLRQSGITRQVEVRDSVTGEAVLRPLCEVATSHMARRTFVGNLYQQVQDPNLIGKMSGHVEGSAAFARYRRIEDETLRRVIKRIE